MKSPKTMEELFKAYGGASVGLKRGLKVKGIVTQISNKRVVIDIGGKSDGIVAEKAYENAKSYIKTLKVGDEVNTKVIVGETPDGFAILSLRDAAGNASWDKFTKAIKEKSEVSVLVKGTNPSGLSVEINGLNGFVPTSQLGKATAKKAKDLVGEHIKVQVIEVDRDKNRLVFSERNVSEGEDIKLIKEAIKEVKEGEILTGKVTTIANFGCFVKVSLGKGKKKVDMEGLVHLSELAWNRVVKTEDVVSVGDTVKVKVIGKAADKLSLSMKQATDDPWTKVSSKYKKDSKHKGTVLRKSDFGVFIELEPGVEGLVHLTKIPPATVLEEGNDVNIVVEEIDPKAKKLSLGLVLSTKPVGYK